MFVEFLVAAKIIETENANVKAQKILVGSSRCEGFNPSRVFVDVNINDVVVLVPKAG